MIPTEGKSNWACGSLPDCSPSLYWNDFLAQRPRQPKITSQARNWPSRKTRTLTHKTITIPATRNVKKRKILPNGRIPPHRRNYLCSIRSTECLQNKYVYKTNRILTFPVIDKRGPRCLNNKGDNTAVYTYFFGSPQVTGYLNLLANGIDNFTHGLAVAGSFLVSTRVGLLTTAAILLHEIPHEVADFAILLRAGIHIFFCCCCYFISFYCCQTNKTAALFCRFRSMGCGKGPAWYSNYRDRWGYDGLNIQRFRPGRWSYYILDSTLYSWRLPPYCFGYW